jgi:Sec-independent protein translocase protein TatA
MRIQDLLIETNLTEEQLDELGFAQGLGNVARTVGKGVGAVKGAYQGAKDAFSAGKNQTAQAVRSAVGGQPAPAGTTTAPANAPVQNTQAADPNAVPGPEAGQVEPTLDTPAAVRNAAAPTSNEVSPQNNVNTTNATATNKAKIGVPQGRQAVDNAMQTVNAVRTDRRADVINYAKQAIDSAEQQLAAIRKNAGIPPAQKTQTAPADNTIDFQQAAGQQQTTTPPEQTYGTRGIAGMGESKK